MADTPAVLRFEQVVVLVWWWPCVGGMVVADTLGVSRFDTT